MVTAMLVILAAAIYNWFVTPHTRYLVAAQRYENAMDLMDKKGKIISGNIKTRKTKLEHLRKDLEQQKQAFFDVNDAKTFLSNLQSTAEQNGCMVANLKFLPSRDTAIKSSDTIDIHQYQVSISILGGYGNIVKFLNTIQNRPEKVWVETIDVGMKPQENYLSCDATISIYTLKIKENAGNVNNK